MDYLIRSSSSITMGLETDDCMLEIIINMTNEIHDNRY